MKKSILVLLSVCMLVASATLFAVSHNRLKVISSQLLETDVMALASGDTYMIGDEKIYDLDLYCKMTSY